jgi:hypothetical protein
MINASKLPSLTFKHEALVYLLPCAEVTLYWAGDHLEKKGGILEFYQQSLDAVGDTIAFYRTETMSSARRVKKDTLDLIPFWFNQPKAKRDIYMMFLESGSEADEPSDRAFVLNAAPGMGFVRLIQPIAHADDADRFLNQALALAQMIPFDFGQAGYSINWNELGLYKSDAVRAMNGLTRYPGLDLADPSTTMFIVTKGIKCVSWLTFISPAYVQRLGGAKKVSAAAGEGVAIHPLRNGIAVQAGPAPEIGDVNRRQNLPNYRSAGHLLSRVRATDHPAIFGPDGLGEEDVTEKWLSRFD